ncbi:MAG: class II fumarate hydratase [Hahellaceae bacterium]|nr:class II fumarate hydratase [Hahellaceae bacterium]MCP5169822.1 class II fumarate hydratase [Hahellaceae bacterium]
MSYPSTPDPAFRAAAHEATDSFGAIELPQGVWWGAQTQRSLEHFRIGHHTFGIKFIQALVTIKRACADTNLVEGRLDSVRCDAILAGCDRIMQGQYDDQFPLHVWQTGSGTQTNMNVNEVISSLANDWLEQRQKAEGQSETHYRVHPNDHVNMSQSSNDIFPSAMHVAVAQATHHQLIPAIVALNEALGKKQKEFEHIFMVGRTHLMDALPLPVSSLFSAFRAQLDQAKNALTESLSHVYALAVGGTAVGSGCNAPAGFGNKVAARLAEQYGLPFYANPNLYAAVSGEDALLRFSAATKQLASVLFKIANDFRLLGSGPRCGFNEWRLPANEPGSSIMPGKVNPTQCEALSMVSLQVMGNDLTVSLAAAQGQLQLNVYRPVIIHNLMESIELLTDSMTSFADFCVRGLALNEIQIRANMARNLSVITLLAPSLGYDVAARIVHHAHALNLSLGQAAQQLALYDETAFDELLRKALAEQER